MSNLNREFYNEYTKLEKLCRELYQHLPKEELKGVTNYINDMKNTPYEKRSAITNWDSQLNALIQARHKRNRLAHEPNAFDENLCTTDDIEFVRYFYCSILSRNDPLAVTHKSKTVKKQANYYTASPKRGVKQKNAFGTLLVWTFVTLTALVFALFIFGIFLNNL